MTPEAAGMYQQPRIPLGSRRENEVHLIQSGPTIALRVRLNGVSRGTIFRRPVAGLAASHSAGEVTFPGLSGSSRIFRPWLVVPSWNQAGYLPAWRSPAKQISLVTALECAYYRSCPPGG